MNNVTVNILFALLACLVMITSAQAGDAVPQYDLTVSFDTERNFLRGEARITLPVEVAMSLGTAGLEVISASLNGNPLEPDLINREKGIVLSGGSSIHLVYEAVFPGTEMDIQNVGVVGSVVSPEGISLTGGWYPEIGGLARYGLRAVVPDGFTAVSEAEQIEIRDGAEGREFIFHFSYPVDRITLVAGKYNVVSDAVGETELYVYFFEEDAKLAKTYLDYTKRYISLYEKMLGDYPYERFSVVENFLPTGYSMPTYTLLGRDVVRLPFIVETSLGHEILHQWFGNSVYGDPAGGNWLEGLTTYLSDHLYEEQNGKGSAYRKKALVDYQSYVMPEKAAPLGKFQGRVDLASKAIGYGKGAMLFHMLKERVGEDVFYWALRSFIQNNIFRRTSWEDLRAAFEDQSGENLSEFFAQWLKRADVPHLEVSEARVRYLEGEPHVFFKLSQQTEKPYKLFVRAKIITEKGENAEVLETGEKEKSFNLPVEGKPIEMVLDEEYDLMRGLWPSEFPPVIARLLGDKNRLIIVPAEGADTYRELTRILRDEGFSVSFENEVKEEDLMTSSVLLLGRDGPLHRRLFGAPVPFKENEGFVFKVMDNPLNPDKVVAVSYASGKAEVDSAARKIFHYGKYSYLRFKEGRNVDKEVSSSDSGMRVGLSHKISGISPGSTLDFEDIIEDVVDKTVIYVGESHTLYEDHRVQLEVIRALKEHGKKFAVGMEMFERPFQQALDDYIAGRTTEKEFLKDSEYFKRWKFDYLLYREIVEYARANGIPVVALNIDSAIIKKVAADGLDALSEDEREEIPADMDMSDESYRNMLEKVFGMHENADEKSFEYFHQSQILWDETMAHAVDEFLRKNLDHQIVVLAGVGHLARGSGIPKRVHRLNGEPYAILLNAEVGSIEEGIADYVLMPEPLEPPKSPLIGVMLRKTEEGVRIEEVRPNSAAELAGMKKGDVIVSMDDYDISDIADIKVVLFDREAGDSIKVKVLRKRFLSRREMELDVTLR